jgi:hypothetical protein
MHLVGQVSDGALVTLGVVIKLAQMGRHVYLETELAAVRKVSVRQIQRHISELMEWEVLVKLWDRVNHRSTWIPVGVITPAAPATMAETGWQL